MCYSASASFTASAVLAVTGMYTLFNVRKKSELFLASIPVFFSVQQFIEGWIWINTITWQNAQLNVFLSLCFLFFALSFWSIWVPASSFFVEPNRIRKKIVFIFFLVGIAMSIYLFFYHIKFLGSEIINNSIYYPVLLFTHERYILGIGYITVTCLSFLVSSYRILQILGLCWFIASLYTLLAWYTNFTSMWCFWSAILSLIICLHFTKNARSIMR